MMFRGMFGGRREGSDYADLARMEVFSLRTRDRILLAILAFFGVILALGLPASTVGTVSELGADGQPLYASADLSLVPQSMADDAARSATQLFGKHGENHDRFVDELLTTYVKCLDKDVVVLFSPGGWGYGPMDARRPWGSILNGIQSQLSDSCVDSEILIYQRSANSSQGRCEELTEIFRDYASKARVLASRVRFLTAHNPDLKVVIVGESTGAVIGGEAMSVLSEDPQVFCIQIGPPCWYSHDDTGRTLVIADNGIAPDSFSRGDALAIIRANLSALSGKSQPDDARGTILKYLRAPGHDYWWDYSAVSSRITWFLEENVGTAKADSVQRQTAGEQIAGAPGE
jgi:hypothetical protein